MVDDRNDILAGIEQLRTLDVVDIVRATSQAEGIDAAVSLLADVQREVGLRWQTQHWPVAEEHAATAIVDIALTAAALETTPPAGEAPLVAAHEQQRDAAGGNRCRVRLPVRRECRSSTRVRPELSDGDDAEHRNRRTTTGNDGCSDRDR